MAKSVNRDDKKNKQARNCLKCDNGDWTHMRAAQCHCKEWKRTASKRRFEKEIDSDSYDCCMYGVIWHEGPCTWQIERWYG